MAATDLDDLNNWEEHWETAAVTFLNSDVGIEVVRTVTEDSLTLPRIEVQLMVEEAYEPAAPRNGGASPSTLDYRAFTSNFVARLLTDNATGGASAHAGYRSKVRTALMRSGSNWTADSVGIGSCSIADLSNQLVGSGTEFTTTLGAADKISLFGNVFTVSSVTTDERAVLSSDSASALSGNALRVFSLTRGPNNIYYDLKHIRLTSNEYEADGDLNVTTMNYSLVWEIRDDAWPSA